MACLLHRLYVPNCVDEEGEEERQHREAEEHGRRHHGARPGPNLIDVRDLPSDQKMKCFFFGPFCEFDSGYLLILYPFCYLEVSAKFETELM
jgi:hypothetical protein